MWTIARKEYNPSRFPNHGEFTNCLIRVINNEDNHRQREFLREYNAFTMEIKWKEVHPEPNTINEEAEQILNNSQKPIEWAKPEPK